MSLKHAIFAFLIVMLAGFSSYILISSGYYPIAVVNLEVVTAREVERDFGAAYRYFENAVLTYGSDAKRLAAPETRKEIWRAALDKIIGDSLVYKELRRRFPGSEYQPVADRKISQFLEDNKSVEEAAKTLYGLDLAAFQQRLLLPQAYRAILEGRMDLIREKFEDWLKNSRAQAKVWILTPELKWEDGQVKLK